MQVRQVTTQNTTHSSISTEESVAPEGWLTAVRWAGLALFFGYVPIVGYSLWRAIDGGVAFAVTATGLLIGYALADLISGIVHWASDTFGRRTHPILGPLFVRPFRDHHVDATAITRESILELQGTNCFFSTPLLVTAHLLQPEVGASASILLCSILMATALGVLAAGQIHRWVHQEKPPTLIAHLQRVGLVISAREHDIHHGGEHTSHYCIVSGWWNTPLKRMDTFARLEVILAGRCGIQTTRHED